MFNLLNSNFEESLHSQFTEISFSKISLFHAWDIM